jgi:quercetin dioxygenase-like cupin family protein
MDNERTREPPVERFASDSLEFDLHAEATRLRAEPTPSRHGHRQKTLYKHAGCTVALFVLEKGAVFPEHSASGVVTVQAIEGDLVLSVAGETRALKAGSVLIMPPAVKHSVQASSPAIFLLQVSLSPPQSGNERS